MQIPQKTLNLLLLVYFGSKWNLWVAFESWKSSMIMDGNQYYIIGKFGVDGSGSHKIRHQLVKNDIALQNIGHVFSSKTLSFFLSF